MPKLDSRSKAPEAHVTFGPVLGQVDVKTRWLCESKQAFPLIKHQCWCDFTPVLDSWTIFSGKKKKKNQNQGGTHCLTASFVIQSTQQQWVQSSGIGADWGCPWFLMIREAGSGQCFWSATLPAHSWTQDWPEHNTAASRCGGEREREKQRDTGQQRHRQGDHRNTNPPPNPQLCRERPTKAFFAFSLKEKKK